MGLGFGSHLMVVSEPRLGLCPFVGATLMPEVLRTVVFVDGQNLYNNLRAFSFETDPECRS